MLELKPRPIGTITRTQAPPESKQPGRLLLALLLLLVALGAVVVRDREFWFGSEQSTIDDAAQPQDVHQAPKAVTAVNHTSSVPLHSAKKQAPAATNSGDQNPAEAPAVTTNRTVLPPLDVEVVAGDSHHKVHPGSNAAKVEITNPADASTISPATNAADRERIADAAQPSYPLLAQHMNVQGSVVLQALIGADGVIQNIHVLSGPAILSSAAQQAVREWHFKPVVQNGQAVETKATITVNFTIKVADNSAKTTLADSRSDRIEILSR